MEIDYNELFEIGSEGGKEQEPATPDNSAKPQEGEDAEPAEGGEAQEGENNGSEPADPAEGTENGEEGSKGGESQPPEENAKYASARRKAEAERDAAVAEAKAKAEAETARTIEDFYRNCGLTNPYTQTLITTKEEYEAYRQQFEAEKRKAFQQKNGMSDQEYEAFISELPEVREAKAEKETAQRSRLEMQKAEAEARVNEQVKEIGTLDPTITKLEDLTKMPTYPKLYELVKSGYTLVDAFKLANFETLTKGAAAEARQAALNAAQGKRHLGATKSRGDGAVTVPSDVMAQYRIFNPDATEAEIRAHYAKSQNK